MPSFAWRTKEHEEDKKLLMDFMDKSKHEISKMSKEVVKKAETGEREAEEGEAEELLKTID